MGDWRFAQADYAEALACLRKAAQSPDGLGNPFVHLHLGQVRYELGDYGQEADELARPYLAGLHGGRRRDLRG